MPIVFDRSESRISYGGRSTEHVAEVDEVFRGKTVLVTGAGGSIGSELARQVLAVGPKRLILLDRAESALFDIHRQLESAPRRHGRDRPAIGQRG